MVKNPPANAGDIIDRGSIPESGRSPGGEHGNPLQYSCLELGGLRELDRTEATEHKACTQSLTTPQSRTVVQEKKKSPKS